MGRQWLLLNLSSTTTSVIPSCSLVPHNYWLASSPGSHTGQPPSQGPRLPYWSGSFPGTQALILISLVPRDPGSHTGQAHSQGPRLPYWSGSFPETQAPILVRLVPRDPVSHTGQAHSQGHRLPYWSGSHTQAYCGNCNRLG